MLLIQERRIEDNTFEHWPAKLYLTHFGKVDDNPGHVKMTLNGALCSLPGVDLLHHVGLGMVTRRLCGRCGVSCECVSKLHTVWQTAKSSVLLDARSRMFHVRVDR